MTSESRIERIRSTRFTLVRKGYDPAQVEQFLAEVADWLETGGTDEARAEIVRREIDRVGERTAGILAGAEDTAEQWRGDAEREVAAMLDRAGAESERERTDADAYAATTRGDADEYGARLRTATDTYAEKMRGDADAYAETTRSTADANADRKQVVADQRAAELIEAAEAKARRIVNDGAKRRREIETVIADLIKRRDEVIASANGLSAALQSVAAGHTPEPDADPFARPRELDPLERGETAESEAVPS